MFGKEKKTAVTPITQEERDEFMRELDPQRRNARFGFATNNPPEHEGLSLGAFDKNGKLVGVADLDENGEIGIVVMGGHKTAHELTEACGRINKGQLLARPTGQYGEEFVRREGFQPDPLEPNQYYKPQKKKRFLGFL